MKRVLHILPSNRFSGAENVVCQIIHMFCDRRDDYEMIYCCPEGPIRFALRERNIQFKPIQKMSINELKGVIRRVNPDIIHAHDMKASVYASVVCGKIPLVSHIHNNDFDSRKPSLKAIMFMYAAIKAKHVFWVSNSALKEYCFSWLFANKSSLLRNIIDPHDAQVKAEMADNKECYDIVYIGRLSYPKNPKRVISIVKAVAEIFPNIRVAIVGTGELEEETKQAVEEAGLNTCIHFLGFISNPLGILKNAKLMIMASRWEGTPMCALEAMALGVPIVSTPTDGLNELIQNGINGYLSNEDDVLVKHCVDLLSDDQLRTHLSIAQLSKSDELNSVHTYMDSLLKYYE